MPVSTLTLSSRTLCLAPDGEVIPRRPSLRPRNSTIMSMMQMLRNARDCRDVARARCSLSRAPGPVDIRCAVRPAPLLLSSTVLSRHGWQRWSSGVPAVHAMGAR
jgi:hypothetical protein